MKYVIKDEIKYEIKEEVIPLSFEIIDGKIVHIHKPCPWCKR